jgi:hypothetical protein
MVEVNKKTGTCENEKETWEIIILKCRKRKK